MFDAVKLVNAYNTIITDDTRCSMDTVGPVSMSNPITKWEFYKGEQKSNNNIMQREVKDDENDDDSQSDDSHKKSKKRKRRSAKERRMRSDYDPTKGDVQ
jgi:hypothetical protein